MKFNRYWICDKSGIGHGKWRYFSGDFEGDRSYAKSWIIETEESWAIYADSYSMDIELDVVPPKAFVEAELQNFEERAEQNARNAEELRNLLKEME
jgi:hypothetical protein